MPRDLQISEALLESVMEKVLRKIAKPKYLTIRDAAKYSGLSPRSIERAVASGELKKHQPTGKVLVKREDIDRWVEGQARA